ncbi:hypothetical protein BB561_002545 [Smittium simulii]|uniref:Uncharacterized protein n=1 Tax=Smittium simulii TaxID=133385 RepID=A0A2T9YQ15_9FUNG|nr:hypothetical protein BB561_002545 [Smittium simulii]
MSGVKYSPSNDKNCKTGTSIQDDVNIIAGSASSVLMDFFDICDVQESIKKFAAKGLDIYLDIDAEYFGSDEYDVQDFEKFIDTDPFQVVKGISVSSNNGKNGLIKLDEESENVRNILKKKNKNISVGIKKDMYLLKNDVIPELQEIYYSFKYYNNSLDYILLSLNMAGSVNSTEIALKTFNENFINLQDLKKPIYLEIIPGPGKFSNLSFLEVLRELECRQSDRINYFMADNFGSDSIFKRPYAYNKLKTLSKNTFACQKHKYIGNWENKSDYQ